MIWSEEIAIAANLVMSGADDVIGNFQDHLGDCYINYVKKIYNFYSYKTSWKILYKRVLGNCIDIKIDWTDKLLVKLSVLNLACWKKQNNVKNVFSEDKFLLHVTFIPI